MNPHLASLATLTLLLVVASGSSIPWASGRKGPREDDLSIMFYGNQTAAYNALARGEIDFMMYDLTSAQADLAFTDPNLVTANVPDSGFYEFDLNNNHTIPDYPAWRSPMNYTAMRQAVAFLADKDYYVDALLGGKAVRIDQQIAAPYYGWANASMSYPHYPYEYSPAGAKAVLDGQFPVGATPNPHYDPAEPLSSPTLRTYPAGHEKAGQTLDPLKFCVRTEHVARRESGRGVITWLKKLGVPILSVEGPSTVLYPIVMDDFNYHFYTGGWSTGRFPSITLYGLYHSDNAFPSGPNYVTGVRPGAPTHPKLDWLLERAYYATNFSDAVKYTKLAVGYMTEICVTVPLWSVASYWAWSNQLLGMVNQQGGSLENDYTFMNAYKVDGSPIRCGTIGLPVTVNMFDGDWFYDLNVLHRMILYSGVDRSAYNTAVDQGGFVRDWEITTWNDNGETKTKVVMTYRSDDYFVEPVSGDQGRNVNATHYFMSMWLYYQLMWSYTDEPHHVDITDSHTFEIYYNSYSPWNIYYCQPRILPIDSWAAYPNLVSKPTENFTNPTTPGDISLSKGPFWIEYATFNGTLLTPFIDYNIVNGKLHIYTALGTGIVEVRYWSATSYTALRGYTVGNLPWQAALEGAGMYYCTGLTPGEGGSATFRRSPYYYMVTPPLGEIDFVKKPNGHYKIDIFDLVLAGGAYGSQGTGRPDRRWFPGADLAPNAGVIDIYDLVTITGTNWDQEFDPTEP